MDTTNSNPAAGQMVIDHGLNITRVIRVFEDRVIYASHTDEGPARELVAPLAIFVSLYRPYDGRNAGAWG